ncbi:MAG: hypothetical protein WCO06_00905 [Candidatus Roizmanbacteria bacterium]
MNINDIIPTFNHNPPSIMHIDLNSCFATVEQQSNIQFRNKPLVVAAYSTPNGFILSPSIEAKKIGIKMGMTVRDARLIYPQVIVRTPDPPKVRDVHIKFRKIFSEYTPNVIPKSIDEAILDFTSIMHWKIDLVFIAKEIKQRMRKEIGEWISCNVGIGTNRFMAKTAAGLHKPNGLDVITHENIIQVLSTLTLIDLNGINEKFQARLNSAGIFTPLQFLEAKETQLKNNVFQSIAGHYWFMRLRGWEVDDYQNDRKSFGQQYALGKPTDDPQELARLLMKLTEKMGRRLRITSQSARGIHIACSYRDYTHWHQGHKTDKELYTTTELFKQIIYLFNKRPEKKVITKLAVTCYDLNPCTSSQMTLFDAPVERQRTLSDTMDKINDKYGEFVITPALMMTMNQTILDRIAFGQIGELEDLYAQTNSF